MNTFLRRTYVGPLTAIGAICALAACEGDLAGPELEDPRSAVVVGQVQFPEGGGGGSNADQSGVVVSVDGGISSDTTDANGIFRIEARSDEGRLRLRFRSELVDARLELAGVQPGTVIRISVTLSTNSAALNDSSVSDRAEFEGDAVLVSAEGASPNRSLTLEVVRPNRSVLVRVAENSTAIDAEGDFVTFDGLELALEAGRHVRIEGDGSRREDGSIDAALIKAESDHDADGHDDDEKDEEEFEGVLTALVLSGAIPSRTMRVTLVDDDDTYVVDIIEGSTTFESDGDVTTFAQMVDASSAGLKLEVEGEGELRDDGTFLARVVEVEFDD